MQYSKPSAFRPRALRQPTDPVRRAQLDLLSDRLLPLYTVLAILWAITAIEWLWVYRLSAPNPLYTTLITVLLSIYVAGRTRPVWRQVKTIRPGFDGVQAVGEFLDRLRGLGYRVFHDIPGDSGNIDHVVLCTHGVYCISTTTRSKPVGVDCVVRYDGSTVSVNDGPRDSSPMVRARAQARQLRRLLGELTELDLPPVRPVVLFPGWRIEAGDDAGPGNEHAVWVLAPRSLPMWINNAPQSVAMKDVRQSARALVAFVDHHR